MIIKENKKEELFYGISSKNSEGFGFSMNKNLNSIIEIGFYQDVQNSNFLEFGKKFSTRKIDQNFKQNVMVEEGIFIIKDN